ncbi:hypothetical protein BJ170DRAFT_14097 [Xylariales sp. AK1849]|nr:hypothetical protein BJ170DRAFT_14097 [Xylariales sp. AK1849]
MPHIGAVMGRTLEEPQSLRDGLKDLLVRSVIAGMSKRSPITDIQGDITDAKTAFSSWDNCMKATFCKWPVIAVIIIGGLIIFSIIWCIIRCACCGLSCCCSCFQCLKCCGNCCGCCDAPQKRHKYLDEPFVPPHHNQGQGYRSEAPMSAQAVPKSGTGPFATSAIAKPDPPQYAEFETGKKGDADELPPMPSWEGANSKKVMLGDEVEMDQLQKPESAQNAPLMAPGAMSHPASPNPTSLNDQNPYETPGYNGSSGYLPPARGETDPYAMGRSGQQQGYGNYGNGGYGQVSREDMTPGYDQGYGNQGYNNQGYANQGYGAAGAAVGAMGQGRRTPHQDYNNGGYRGSPAGQGYPQSRTPRPYDEYGRSGTPRSGTPGNGNAGYGRPPYDEYGRSGTPRSGTPGNGNAGYGRPPPRRSPTNGSYGDQDRLRSRAPQQGGYGFDQRSNTPNSYGRQYPAALQRQYSSDSTRPLARPAPERSYTDDSYQQGQAHSPIQNSGGFDFTSGFSRPETSDHRPSPPPQQNTGGGSAYPGYRAYKPAQ